MMSKKKRYSATNLKFSSLAGRVEMIRNFSHFTNFICICLVLFCAVMLLYIDDKSPANSAQSLLVYSILLCGKEECKIGQICQIFGSNETPENRQVFREILQNQSHITLNCTFRYNSLLIDVYNSTEI